MFMSVVGIKYETINMKPDGINGRLSQHFNLCGECATLK